MDLSERLEGIIGPLSLDLLEDFVIPRLCGRSLARLACSTRAFRELMSDDHPAWWSAHSQLLTGKQRWAVRCGRGKGEKNKGATPPPRELRGRAAFLDLLMDTCTLCGTRGEMEVKLPTIKRCMCGSCLFNHQDKKSKLQLFERQVQARVMTWDITKRRKMHVEPILAEQQLQNLVGPSQGSTLLWSTRYHGRATSSFYVHTRGLADTLLVVETKCGAVLGAYVPSAWRNSGSRDYGSGGGVLFSWKPTVKFYACAQQEGVMRGGGGGIGLGGVEKQAALRLEHDFTRGYSSASHTYCNPPLMSESPFTVAHVEVWKVGHVEQEEAEAEDEGPHFVDEIAEMRNPKKKSILSNGVERFMLSFVGVGGALSTAMHIRNYT